MVRYYYNWSLLGYQTTDFSLYAQIWRKSTALGLINGMSEYSTQSRINEKIGLNLQAGDVKVIERFFELHPNIDIWRDESVKGARSKGSISTGLGRYLDVTQETKTTTLYNFSSPGDRSRWIQNGLA